MIKTQCNLRSLKPPWGQKNNGAHSLSLLLLLGYKLTRGGHFQFKYNNFDLPIV
jgi:hypothetical protein